MIKLKINIKNKEFKRMNKQFVDLDFVVKKV